MNSFDPFVCSGGSDWDFETFYSHALLNQIYVQCTVQANFDEMNKIMHTGGVYS